MPDSSEFSFDLDINEVWSVLKNNLVSCASEVCGVGRVGSVRKGISWWNDDVKKVIEVKKAAFVRFLSVKDSPGVLRDSLLIQYKEMKKLAKKCINENRNKFEKDRDELLCSNYFSNKKLFWDGIRRMKISNDNSIKAIKSSGGDLLWSENEIMNRWCEYFKDLYGSSCGFSSSVGSRLNTEFECSIDLEDVLFFLNRSKMGKSVGFDGISNEMLKFGNDRVLE